MIHIYLQNKAEAEQEDFSLGSMPRDNQVILLNGNIHITCAILRLVTAFVVEAKLGTLFSIPKKQELSG